MPIEGENDVMASHSAQAGSGHACAPSLFRKQFAFGNAALFRLIAVLLVGLIVGNTTFAREREYIVKGGFLYNFGVYVDWPEAPDPFIIGVLGEDPFGEVLDEIARRKKLKGAPIQIRRFKDVSEYSPVHLLFVAEPEMLPAAMEKIGDNPVLIVADTEGAARRGATINFYIEQDKVRFEVNREAATRKGLKISSQLLRFARIVDEGQQSP